MTTNKILVIGYGNPGRQDDGIGPEFIRRLSLLNLHGVDTESNYHLTVENAYDIADTSTVIFVDASLVDDAPFAFKTITTASTSDETANNQTLTSHSMSPEAVTQLARTLYNVSPNAFVLAIRGYYFDKFEEKLSEQADKNVQHAIEFLMRWVNKKP